MKTHTSKSRIWTRSLLLLPLLAILIYSFSTKETFNKSILKSDNSFVNDFYLKIDSDENIYYNDELISFDEIPNAIKSYKETYPNEALYFAKIDIDNRETMEKLAPFSEIIKENGIEKITVCWVKLRATKEQLETYNRLAKKYNNQDKENRVVLMKDLEQLEYIYNLMTPEQKANAEPFPDCFPPPPPFVSLKPLDYIINMAKNNAAFFYENERISSDKAISLIKENSKLNIKTTTFKNSNPIVKITKNGNNNSNTNIPPPPPPKTPFPPVDPIKNIEN